MMSSSPFADSDRTGGLDPDHRGPYIKICGNLHATDSLLVASYAPDFMGWIFSPFSPRRIERLRAAHLIRRIREIQPSIRHVGVFAGNPPDWIVETDRRLRRSGGGLDYLQITESTGFIVRLRARLRYTHGVAATPVIPVIRPTAPISKQSFAFTAPSPFWILDRFDPHAKGGTGKRIPPEFFHSLEALERHEAKHPAAAGQSVEEMPTAGRPAEYPFLIAGGIRPENAVEALRESGARGIDVSSGLERQPGVKDPELLKALFQALRG